MKKYEENKGMAFQKGGAKAYKGGGVKEYVNMKKYEGQGRRKSYTDTILGIAPSTEREGGSPANFEVVSTLLQRTKIFSFLGTGT